MKVAILNYGCVNEEAMYDNLMSKMEQQGIESAEKIDESDYIIVITCGGGGIPVIYTNDGYKGIDAVIDKDRTSALLASKIGADILLILTAINEVKIHFNQLNEEGLRKITVDEAMKYIADGEFAAGSMLPKIEACIYFLLRTKKTKAIIASLEDAKEAIGGKKGTTIIKGGVESGKY